MGWEGDSGVQMAQFSQYTAQWSLCGGRRGKEGVLGKGSVVGSSGDLLLFYFERKKKISPPRCGRIV